MHDLKVAIVELEEEDFEGLRDLYGPIFRMAGYNAVATHFKSENALMRTLERSHYHVVICDLSLGSENNWFGLRTIKNLKAGFPEITCVGNTRGDLTYQQTPYPSFDIFVDKGKLNREQEKYQKQIAEQFRRVFRQNVDVEIDSESDVASSKRFRDPQDKTLQSIVSQVTFTTHTHDQATDIRRVKLEPLTGGRSGSDVFKMVGYGASESLSFIPAVLKISDIDNARREWDNYRIYVKWLIPFSWRADVLGIAFTKRLGALCYSFIHSRGRSFDSLTRYIEMGDDSAIALLAETILSPDLKRWYGLTVQESNISRRYLQRFFSEDGAEGASRAQFERMIRVYAGASVSSREFSLGRREHRLPHEVLLRELRGTYTSCLCHGDLNSNNIMVSSSGELMFIDFQHTGWGHAFEDFIMLEISVRLHWPRPNEAAFSDRLEVEGSLIEFGASVQEAELKQISLLRRAAVDNFPAESFRNYLYGLSVMIFSILRYGSVEEWRRARLLPCLVASIAALESA